MSQNPEPASPLNRRDLPVVLALVAMAAAVYLSRFFAGVSAMEPPRMMDVATQWMAGYKLIGDAYRQGFFPLWNAGVYSGMPWVAYTHAAVLYPFNALFLYLYDFPDATTLLHWVHATIAIVGVYLLARDLAASRLAAFMAATAFTFSGFYFFMQSQLSHHATMAWLGFVLFFMRRGLLRMSWSWLAGAGAMMALMIYGGDAEGFIYALVFIALFILLIVRRETLAPASFGVRGLDRAFPAPGLDPAPLSDGASSRAEEKRGQARALQRAPLWKLLLAAASTFALAGFLALPMITTALELQHLSIRSSSSPFDLQFTSMFDRLYLYLPFIIAPWKYYAELHPNSAYNHGLAPFYFGALPLALSVYALIARKQDPKMAALAYLGLAITAFIVVRRLQSLDPLLSRLPLIGLLHTVERALELSQLAFLLASALALDRLRAHPSPRAILALAFFFGLIGAINIGANDLLFEKNLWQPECISSNRIRYLTVSSSVLVSIYSIAGSYILAGGLLYFFHFRQGRAPENGLFFGVRRLDAAFSKPGLDPAPLSDGASSRAEEKRHQAAALQSSCPLPPQLKIPAAIWTISVLLIMLTDMILLAFIFSPQTDSDAYKIDKIVVSYISHQDPQYRYLAFSPIGPDQKDPELFGMIEYNTGLDYPFGHMRLPTWRYFEFLRLIDSEAAKPWKEIMLNAKDSQRSFFTADLYTPQFISNRNLHLLNLLAVSSLCAFKSSIPYSSPYPLLNKGVNMLSLGEDRPAGEERFSKLLEKIVYVDYDGLTNTPPPSLDIDENDFKASVDAFIPKDTKLEFGLWCPYCKDKTNKFDIAVSVVSLIEGSTDNILLFEKTFSGSEVGGDEPKIDVLIDLTRIGGNRSIIKINLRHQSPELFLIDPRFVRESALFQIVLQRDIDIFNNRFALSRAFVLHDSIELGHQEALEFMGEPARFDPGHKLVFEEGEAPPTGLVELARRGEAIPGTPRAAEYKSRGDQDVEVTAESPAPGWLFVSDAYYPGWKAYLDGLETRIQRADLVFRAVFVPDGPHQVRFSYQPISFRLGLFFALTSLVVVGALAIKDFTRRRGDAEARRR